MTIEEIVQENGCCNGYYCPTGDHNRDLRKAIETYGTAQRAEGRREEASRISDLQAKLRFLEMAGRNTIKIKDVRYYLSQSE